LVIRGTCRRLLGRERAIVGSGYGFIHERGGSNGIWSFYGLRNRLRSLGPHLADEAYSGLTLVVNRTMPVDCVTQITDRLVSVQYRCVFVARMRISVPLWIHLPRWVRVTLSLAPS
jgi:hypothetical protein